MCLWQKFSSCKAYAQKLQVQSRNQTSQDIGDPNRISYRDLSCFPPLPLTQLLLNNQLQAPSYRPSTRRTRSSRFPLLSASQVLLRSRGALPARGRLFWNRLHHCAFSEALGADKPLASLVQGGQSIQNGKGKDIGFQLLQQKQSSAIWRSKVRQQMKILGGKRFLPKTKLAKEIWIKKNGMKISGEFFMLRVNVAGTDTIRRKENEEKI